MKKAILIANAARARLFTTPGPVSRAQLVWEREHVSSRKRANELVTDGVHGGKAPKNSPKAVEQEHFAEEIAHLLNKERAKQSYEQLVLVAPAHFLGVLAKHLDHTTQKIVTKKVNKDLVHLKVHALLPSLERFW